MAVTSETPRLSVIVPTLGWSRWLADCLDALRRQTGGEGADWRLEIILVSQGEGRLNHRKHRAEELADVILQLDENTGFASANNYGLRAARGEYLATVNDDAIVEDGWCEALLTALDRDESLAAAQGVNLQLDEPSRIDGAGLAWNRHWQAVQIGHGERLEALSEAFTETPTEIFGVSATAAIYRRSALAKVSGPHLAAFDDRLFAYYEDVDLACRLRAAGYRALRVPEARARHAGSLSGQRLAGGKRRLITRNRHLVLANMLGRRFWLLLPRILARDLADLWRAGERRDRETIAGILGGLGGALRRGPRFSRLGPSTIPSSELEAFITGPSEIEPLGTDR
ncbi:MAG: glycosyltransferase family 2 protein [Acidobacteriota bacterium]